MEQEPRTVLVPTTFRHANGTVERGRYLGRNLVLGEVIQRGIEGGWIPPDGKDWRVERSDANGVVLEEVTAP